MPGAESNRSLPGGVVPAGELVTPTAERTEHLKDTESHEDTTEPAQQDLGVFDHGSIL